eukprot:325293_1
MADYCGTKLKSHLNKTNFTKCRNKQRPTMIEQEADGEMVRKWTRTLRTDIKYHMNGTELKVFVENPSQLGSIVGSQNVMRISDNFEYFCKYPIVMRYAFKIKYPKWIIKLEVLRKKTKGNIER